MDTGTLVVRVYADNIAQPVEGASVRVGGLDMVYHTGATGCTPDIALQAPDIIYSQMPQTKVKPYSSYDVTVTKQGLRTKIIRGVQIFPQEKADQQVMMSSSARADEGPEIIDIPEHGLWVCGAPKIPEETNKPLRRLLPEPVVPLYILVHDGIPANTWAPAYTVPFTDYIKNVASGGIYGTWPAQAIKANVLAMTSFTLNRVFTEWYRGCGFTVTSEPAYDQKYFHGRTVVQSVSKVVDEVFRQYIHREGAKQPLFAQCCDGVRANHAGWLSQWGSKALGDQGYSAADILKYYYGNNIVLDYAAAEAFSCPDSPISMGACGEAVLKMQNQLNVIRGSYPDIPAIVKPNGIFDGQTQKAVGVFQKIFGLPETGVVDDAAWHKISFAHMEIIKMLSAIYR